MIKYNADIICCQEMDNFNEWWRKEFNKTNYSSSYISFNNYYIILII